MIPQQHRESGDEGNGHRLATPAGERSLKPNQLALLSSDSGLASGSAIMPDDLICASRTALGCSQLTDLCTYVNSKTNNYVRPNTSSAYYPNGKTNNNIDTLKRSYNRSSARRYQDHSALRKRRLSCTPPLLLSSSSPSWLSSPLSAPTGQQLLPGGAKHILPASTNSQSSASKHFFKAKSNSKPWTMSLLFHCIAVLCFLSIHGIVVVAEANLDIPDSRSPFPDGPNSVPQYHPFFATKDYEDPCKAGMYVQHFQIN